MSAFGIVWMLILFGAGARGTSCKTNWTVELNEPTVFDNLTILDKKDGVLYAPNEYIKREVENSTKYWGCLCDIKTCIRKCCPLGENLEMIPKKNKCVPRLGNGTDFMVNVTDMKTQHSYFVNRSSHFRWIYGFGKKWFFLDPENNPDDVYYINAVNGKLTTPHFGDQSYGIHEFCVDYFNQTNKYKVLLWNAESDTDDSRKVTSILYPVLMIISLPPLLITFTVYTVIVELRNLHGYCLLSYVASLFFFYVSFVMGHTGIDWLPTGACYFVDLLFISAFSFHYSKIRAITGTEEEKDKKKFIYYSLYCWGCAAVLLIAAVVFEFAPGIPEGFVKPGIAIDRCWFKDKKADFCFCYAPASILMISNIIMFILTAFNLMKMNREMRVMEKAGASSNERRRNKSMMYMKLMTMMGINWALEVTSWGVGGKDHWWYFIDVFNCLQGWFVFFIFVYAGKPRELAMRKFFPRMRRTSYVMKNSKQGVNTLPFFGIYFNMKQGGQ
ncbi:hypothetical protein J437_LFUL014822 [Ladona fulva]|uniref:G-protein coupled receptors family 2 profile 2 domain-containing protein n=1 Tax=Ladona fulva TaxID=123851 RepID=A0A8K0KRW4_LADFU|nr:hypothetical protein J437_LFUL014822 [Ladona fulva]